MSSFPTARPWLASARTRLRELAALSREGQDPVSRFFREHPGTYRVGHVLCHAESFSHLQSPTDLLDSTDTLVLLDREGRVVVEIPHKRIRSVDCARANEEACRDPRLPQSEEHLFIRFETDDGSESRIEVSVGALDDVGPVHQMCERLRSRIGLPPAEAQE